MGALDTLRHRPRASASPPWRGTATAISRPTSACRAGPGAAHPQRAAFRRRARVHHERRRRPGRARRSGLPAPARARSPRSCPACATSSCSAPTRAGTSAGAVAYEDLIAGEPTHYEQPTSTSGPRAGCATRRARPGGPRGWCPPTAPPICTPWRCRRWPAWRIGPGDCVLPQVPMFHANAWGMPYAASPSAPSWCFYAGAFEPTSFVDLLADERVTVSAGVPTVWIGVGRRAGAGRPRGARLDCATSCCGGQPAARGR